jgi:thiamine biosynthesis lipoprotein
MRAQNFQLDTLVTITIHDSSDQNQLDEAFLEIARLESILSAVAPGSDLDRLAQNAGRDYIEVSGDTLFLLEESARFSAMSGGAFDCTVGLLVLLWDSNNADGRIPSAGEIAGALALVDYRDVLLKDSRLAMLRNPGMRVDLGAIAKGYIADRVRELLIAGGVRSAVIDLGGDIALIGSRPDGAPFRIGVRDPARGSEAYLGVFEVSDTSLVSTGPYERYFVHEGAEYHHLFDVGTGLPVDNELLQVTIVSGSATDGEGFSTAAFLLGLEQGFALVSETDGVEGVFVTRDSKVYVTDGIGGMFTLVSGEYAFAELF